MANKSSQKMQAEAWFAVWDLCTKMGMDYLDNNDTGLNCVLSFIKSLPNTACSRRVPRRGAKVVKSKSKVSVGRTRG